mmetsp:Transcript_17830/g.39516  ORF Transcript_17830/g.39516 Transcript_17830/m.39516 type:complete len:250 (-) Transcript_17830:800-1549(-)
MRTAIHADILPFFSHPLAHRGRPNGVAQRVVSGARSESALLAVLLVLFRQFLTLRTTADLLPLLPRSTPKTNQAIASLVVPPPTNNRPKPLLVQNTRVAIDEGIKVGTTGRRTGLTDNIADESLTGLDTFLPPHFIPDINTTNGPGTISSVKVLGILNSPITAAATTAFVIIKATIIKGVLLAHVLRGAVIFKRYRIKARVGTVATNHGNIIIVVANIGIGVVNIIKIQVDIQVNIAIIDGNSGVSIVA